MMAAPAALPATINVSAARLPQSYEAAKVALSNCARCVAHERPRRSGEAAAGRGEGMSIAGRVAYYAERGLTPVETACRMMTRLQVIERHWPQPNSASGSAGSRGRREEPGQDVSSLAKTAGGDEPTAATGSFPFAHRTVAEVDAEPQQAEPAREAVSAGCGEPGESHPTAPRPTPVETQPTHAKTDADLIAEWLRNNEPKKYDPRYAWGAFRADHVEMTGRSALNPSVTA